MKCEFCDSIIKDVPDNGICPNCGGALPINGARNPKLEDYYYRFGPNRVKAVKALRQDTGMGLVEAKNMIDSVFDTLSGESHEDLSVTWKNVKDAFKSLFD